MRTHSCAVLLVTVFAYYGASDAARILGVFNMPAPSHFILGSRLLKELAKRGHDVTMISPFPQKKPIPNYTDVNLEGLLDSVKSKLRF